MLIYSPFSEESTKTDVFPWTSSPRKRGLKQQYNLKQSRYKNRVKFTKRTTLSRNMHFCFGEQTRSKISKYFSIIATVLTSSPQLLQHPRIKQLLKGVTVLIQAIYGFRFISATLKITKFNLMLSISLGKYYLFLGKRICPPQRTTAT